MVYQIFDIGNAGAARSEEDEEQGNDEKKNDGKKHMTSGRNVISLHNKKIKS